MNQRTFRPLAVVLSLLLGVCPSVTAARAEGISPASRPAGVRTIVPAPRSRLVRPARAQTTAAAQLPGQSATLLPDGSTLLVGGETPGGSPSAAAATFNARTGETTQLGAKLSQARAWHTATTLPDGRVLVYGGVGAGGRVLGDAELFDPATAMFTTAATGLSPRARHTATLLTDGRVLFVGGELAKGGETPRTELWRQQTNAVVSAAVLNGARRAHRATLLADGNVLLEGGEDAAGRAVAFSELYSVDADSFGVTSLTSDQSGDRSPYLSASLPTSGATDVAADAVIALRFSQRLRVESINSETVSLSSTDGAVEARVVAAEQGALAFITPLKPLGAGITYTVTLSGATDGAQMLAPAIVTFTTSKDDAQRQQPAEADWLPGGQNMHGNWHSGQARSPWEDQPQLQAQPGVTALSGQTLTLLGQPLSDVTITIGGRSVRTDRTGRFLVTSLAAGHAVMLVDGRTASQPHRVFGLFRIGVEVAGGKTNVLPFTIWMPRLDMAHAATVASPTQDEAVVTNPYLPGLELHLPPDTLIRDIDGQPVTQISITPVPTDRPPFPLPPGYNVPIFFTIQPGGARLIPPRARLIYPNYTGASPGTRINFWNYDPEGRGWYVYGQGTVTPDGRQVVPDAGVVLYEFNGIMIANNDPNVPNKSPKPDGDSLPCRLFGWFCSDTPGGPGSGPSNGPGGPPNRSGPGADPVDLATGIFSYMQTDLYLPDILPLALVRTYRSEDSVSRPFGIGATHPYEMFLSSVNNYQEADLILPTGARLHYVRISPGTGFTDAIYEHTATPNVFYKSRLSWNGTGWDVKLKDGTVFVFGEFAPLQAIRDRFGNQITITRSNGQSGNVTQVTSPNGRWFQFTYDASGRIIQAKDNIGRTVGYTYDASGRLWKVTDPANGVTEYTYDSAHRMLTVKDPRGHVYLTNEYDANGRVFRQTQLNLSSYQLAYTQDGGGNVTQTQVTSPRGNVRRVTFNADGYPVTDTYAVGRPEQQSLTYERAAGSNMISGIVDSLNRHTTFARNTDGFITDVTLLAGSSSSVTYHQTYEPTYDRLTGVTDPLNHSITFGYNSRGSLTSATDALSHQTTFTVNAAGQVLSVTDPLNHAGQFTYSNGDLVRTQDATGRASSRFLDGAGRVVSATNALGHTSRFEYDGLNRMTRVVGPLQGASSLAYDANGNLTSVTDARNGVVSYTYDDMDRPTARRDPLLRDVLLDYNADHTLRQVTDRKGQVTAFAYDNLNRLTQITYQGGSTVAYTYDAANRPTQIVDSISGTISYVYDNLDRVTSRTTPQGTVSYTYDAAGRRATMTVPGQAIVSYTYDAANRPTQITQGAATVSFGYDNAGHRTSLTLPNGVVTEYGYDNSSQLISLTYKKGGVVLGNLTFEYDAAGRCTKMGGSYARTGLAQSLAAATYNAANQQTSFGVQTLTYDLNGNLTGDGTNTYTWNARNQLVAITGPGLSASFQYNAFGARVSKTVNGVTTEYLYDGLNVVQEQSGGVAVANMLAGGVDEVFTRADAGGTWSPLVGAAGSTIAVTNASGAVQTEYTYDPFGRTTATGSASANTAQYTGRENDGTGLYYYRGRYYSPALQRFISEDPIGMAGGLNLYRYVGNNPISLRDPLGLKPNNPGDSPDDNPDDIVDALKKFVNHGKQWNKTVIAGAAMEAGGPVIDAFGDALRSQLSFEEASSIFTPNGLHPDVINGSREIIPGSQLNNPEVIRELTRDGSNITDWGKYATETFKSPSGDFQVHYYYNRVTNQINTAIDFKVVFNRP